jgi:hypothetical protein
MLMERMEMVVAVAVDVDDVAVRARNTVACVVVACVVDVVHTQNLPIRFLLRPNTSTHLLLQ